MSESAVAESAVDLDALIEEHGIDLERDPTWSDDEWTYQRRKALDLKPWAGEPGDDQEQLQADAELEAREAAQAAQERQEVEDVGGDAGDGKAEELRGEAGEPVGAMPPGEPEESTIAPDQIVVQGTAQRRDWAGKAPSSTVLKLKGASFEVDGAFEKGEIVRFSGSARISSEGVKDVLDPDTRQPTDAVQEHSALVLDFEIAE